MLRNKLHHTLLVTCITVSLILSTGLAAFASSSKSTATTKAKIVSMQRSNPLVSVLETQVTNGFITPAKSHAIKENIFADFVTAGVLLTHEGTSAILDYVEYNDLVKDIKKSSKYLALNYLDKNNLKQNK